MSEKYLTKIEINLPFATNTIDILKKIKDLFIDTKGIGGCTYSIPSNPPIFKGEWFNAKSGKIISDNIVWIYGCYDIEKAAVELNDLLEYIRQMIETEGGEDLAWITYSNVAFA